MAECKFTRAAVVDRSLNRLRVTGDESRVARDGDETLEFVPRFRV
jgi:hypothetical protein